MDVAEFLLARIAEDEAGAKEATVLDGAYPDGFEISYMWLREVYDVAAREKSYTNVTGVRAPSPDRVIAECEAKRRIVGQYQQALNDTEMDVEWNDGYCVGQEFALKLLALPHADHPDYDPGWGVPVSA